MADGPYGARAQTATRHTTRRRPTRSRTDVTTARRERVELVTHGKDGRIQDSDTKGYDDATQRPANFVGCVGMSRQATEATQSSERADAEPPARSAMRNRPRRSRPERITLRPPRGVRPPSAVRRCATADSVLGRAAGPSRCPYGEPAEASQQRRGRQRRAAADDTVGPRRAQGIAA